MITAPGVYDLPVDEYHADPVAGGSLSSTGARMLLPPSCPALFRHWLDEPEPVRAVFDFGAAAHRLVLGAGPELVVVDARDWRTKAAKEAAAEARERGAVPLLPADHERVHAMAAALRAHPLAARLLDPARGRAEQTLVWQDKESGVWCRALLDFLRHRELGRRLIIVDYKTCATAAPDKLPRTIADYGYHVQLDWYLSGVDALGLAAGGEPAAGVLIFQEKTPPYLVTVAAPDRPAMEIARTRNRKARDVYRQCVATGMWPGYAEDVVPVGLPAWAEYQHADAEAAGDFDLTTKESA